VSPDNAVSLARRPNIHHDILSPGQGLSLFFSPLITKFSLQNLQIPPHYVSHNVSFQTETIVHANEGFAEKCFPAEGSDYLLEIVLHVTRMSVCSAMRYTN
jgi:hypothetical protein